MQSNGLQINTERYEDTRIYSGKKNKNKIIKRVWKSVSNPANSLVSSYGPKPEGFYKVKTQVRGDEDFNTVISREKIKSK